MPIKFDESKGVHLVSPDSESLPGVFYTKDEGPLGDRLILTPEAILNNVKKTGKIPVHSSDFMFPNDAGILNQKAAQSMEQYGLTSPRDFKRMNRTYPTGRMEAALQGLWDINATYEPVAAQAMSRGIQDVYGFKPHHKIQDVAKEIASSIGAENLPVKFQYSPRYVGATDYQNIYLNPQHLNNYGREAVLAHELRHVKEAAEGFRPSTTLGKPREGLEGLLDQLKMPELYKKLEGKALQAMEKGKFKETIDALDVLDFAEKGHFKTSFMKENLKRVAKGLPLLSALGALIEPDAASAAAEAVVPGGVEGLGDRRGPEEIRRSQEDAYMEVLRNQRGLRAQ